MWCQFKVSFSPHLFQTWSWKLPSQCLRQQRLPLQSVHSPHHQTRPDLQWGGKGEATCAQSPHNMTTSIMPCCAEAPTKFLSQESQYDMWSSDPRRLFHFEEGHHTPRHICMVRNRQKSMTVSCENGDPGIPSPHGNGDLSPQNYNYNYGVPIFM